MTGSRLAVIPLAHLRAEIAAFPVASEAAFAACLTDVKPDDDKTDDVWRAAERELVRASPALSLDELVAMRDDVWFSSSTPPGRSMRSHLLWLASEFLEPAGPVAVPRTVADQSRNPLSQAEARTDWRWLTLALPPDLLLAALPAGGRPSAVEMMPPVLAQSMADGGFSEPHLHLNAAFDFGRLWVMTLRGLADGPSRPGAFRSPGAAFDEGAQLGPWLLRAAVVRYVLAAFLFTDHASTRFRGYMVDEVHQRLSRHGAALDGFVLAQVATELLTGQLRARGADEGFGADHAAVRALYKLLIDVRLGCGPEDPDQLWDWDPVHPLVGRDVAGLGTPEVQLVAEALAYIGRAKDDVVFARLFWQVVRVRCILYRHLVQRPMTPGLQWFVRSFSRLKSARDGIRSTQASQAVMTARTAARLSGAGVGLHSLEVRIAPDEDYSRLFSGVKALNQALRPQFPPAGSPAYAPAGPAEPRAVPVSPGGLRSPGRRFEGQHEHAGPEFGIVLHLKRDRGGGWAEGRPRAHWAQSEADPGLGTPDCRKPSSNVTGYRYGRFYREARASALSAARLLCDCPTSLEVVRGIDLCTDEAGVPTWVMKPLVRYIRDAGHHAAAAMHRRRATRPTPALRTTVHAGEDFDHLLSGLRRLDDVLEHLGLVEGDRLGHALALGVEPRRWAERAGRVAMAEEERLLDLAWEWSWYVREGQGALDGRMPLIEGELADRSERIFGECLHPRELARLVKDLHDENKLRASGFPDRPVLPRPPTQDLRACVPASSLPVDDLKALRRYLTCPSVFKRGRRIVRIDPEAEADSLAYLQNALRKKVGRMGLTIEVNPSSNLLIGHLGDLKDHPLWRLAPVVNEEGVEPLSVCIGSDDPLTFATTLPQEYQLLYDALMQNGCSNATAHGWLERARVAGLNSRFTLPQSAEAQDPEAFGYVSGDSLSLVLPP